MVRIVMNRGVEGLSTCNIIQTGIRLLHVRFNAKIVIGNVLPLVAILLSDYPGSKRYLHTPERNAFPFDEEHFHSTWIS